MIVMDGPVTPSDALGAYKSVLAKHLKDIEARNPADAESYCDKGVGCIFLHKPRLSLFPDSDAHPMSEPTALVRSMTYGVSTVAGVQAYLSKTDFGDAIQRLDMKLQQRKKGQLIVVVTVDDTCDVFLMTFEELGYKPDSGPREP